MITEWAANTPKTRKLPVLMNEAEASHPRTIPDMNITVEKITMLRRDVPLR